ncbi:hypothetical protein GCM10009872_18500 [Actinopolymorpha rutila]
MAHVDAEAGKPRPEDLPGYTTDVTSNSSGRIAFLNSDCDPEFPWWFRLVVEHSAAWAVPPPPELRLAGPLAWSPDGSALSVGAFRGTIRLPTSTCGSDPSADTWKLSGSGWTACGPGCASTAVAECSIRRVVGE